MANKKLNDYVENIKIPKPEDVLPKECIKEEEVSNDNVDGNNNGSTENVLYSVALSEKTRKRKYMYAGAGALVACCAAFSLFVMSSSLFDKGDNSGGTSSNNSNRVVKNDLTTDSDKTESNGDKTVLDGVISGSGSGGGSSLSDSYFECDESFAYESTDMAASSEGDKAAGTDVDISPDVEMEMPSESIDCEAGTLTGGEIRDLHNWDNWLKNLDSNYMKLWDIVADKKVSVYVHYGDTPLSNVKVKLIANQEVVYEAVTDASGNAHLFYNYHAEDNSTPDKIEVENKDGGFDSYSISDYANSKNELEIESDMTNNEINLDLMFVVDTTGSMGDELDYLKAELEDVINRVEDETGVSIRTSVNFYRDEEDEYVVKYYDFRDDPAEITSILKEQNADGGGDWEEAVHTALDNAINEHSWGDDSTTKLMFLVLDAPAHNTDEIKEQLAKLVEKASKEGIRIIPVAASGADKDTQQLLRTFAVMTGGTFIFLDDNSGVGLSHDVTVKDDEYTSETLNNMLIRVIGEYCGVKIDVTKAEIPTQQPTQNPNQQ